MVLGLLGIAACSPGEVDPERLAATSTTTPQAARLFDATCLDSLPNFEGFDARAQALGLSTDRSRGRQTVYNVPGEATFVTLFSTRGATACTIAFVENVGASTVAQAFLAQAQKRTDGPLRASYNSDFFEAAHRLSNGSVFAYDRRDDRGAVRHIISVSIPISDEEVSKYIFD